jgi:hypothetical protein
MLASSSVHFKYHFEGWWPSVKASAFTPSKWGATAFGQRSHGLTRLWDTGYGSRARN